MLVATGLAVGLLVGMTGVGGGAVMTPALILYGVDPAVAVGTDLVYAAITKSTGVMLHHSRGNVRWGVVARLAVGSLPAALFALWWLGRYRSGGGDHAGIITAVLGGALVLTAFIVLARPRIGSFAGMPAGAPRGVVTIVGGVVLGALVALSSVGAGAVGAALLLCLYPRLSAASVVGTDLAHAVMLAAVAGFGHWQMGGVDVDMLWPLLVGSLPGVYVGARLTSLVPDRLLTRVMALVLLSVGLGFSLGAVN